MTLDEYKELRLRLIYAKVSLRRKPAVAMTKEEYLLMDLSTAEALVAANMGVSLDEFRRAARQGDKTVNHARNYGTQTGRLSMKNQFGFEERDSKTRACRNTFYIHTDESGRDRINAITCTRQVGHNGNHAGRSSASGLSVEWTDQQAKESRRPPPKKITGAIPAWRLWRLSKHDKLQSISADDEWNGPVMTTKRGPDGQLMRVRTEAREHGFSDYFGAMEREPNVDFGVHCYKTVDALYRNHDCHYPIIGRIDLTGHVIEHQWGYRAQIATVRELWYFSQDDVLSRAFQEEAFKSMERRYECEVHFVPLNKKEGWLNYMRGEVERHGKDW